MEFCEKKCFFALEFCETICCRWRNKDIFDDGFEVDTMSQPELPLKGNYNPDNFKLYFYKNAVKAFENELP